MATVDEIGEVLKGFETRIGNKVDDLIKEVRIYNAGIRKIQLRQDNLEQENKILREDVEALKGEIDFLVNKERERNVILFKVKDSEPNNKDLMSTVNDIFGKAGIVLPKDDIKEASRLGNKEGTRPILIKLASTENKTNIFGKSDEIKELGFRVAQDRSKRQRDERNKLISIQNTLKQFNIYCTIKNRKIIVNNVEYDSLSALKLINNGNLRNEYDDDEVDITEPQIVVTPSRKRPRLELTNPRGSRNWKQDSCIRDYLLSGKEKAEVKNGVCKA